MRKNGPSIHDQYSRWFYDTEAPFTVTWRGIATVKCPYDMWFYADIVYETKPDLIIETGTFMGGSALFLAQMCDINDHGHVLSIDLATDRELPNHPRIDFLCGMSSTSKEVLEYVGKMASGKRCMVILDSAHNRAHVLDEIKAYSKFVAKGCYLIVEDTNIHGYQYGIGDIQGDDDGPAEAIKDFQPTNRGFSVDRRFERLGFSQNPGGYLLRVR